MTAKQIAIDGPAGAGKSTVAKLVACRLGYLYLDTGAMYRALALAALRLSIDVNNGVALTALAEKIRLEMLPADNGCRVILDGEDVSQLIRTPEVGNAASPVSAFAEVRAEMVRRQQQMAADRPVVMDGRDIGTVVLPQAECKIYLTADLHTRAQRRTAELMAKGEAADAASVEKEMKERDYRDSHRDASPLRQADDAVLLDSSSMSIEQVTARILQLAGAEQA